MATYRRLLARTTYGPVYEIDPCDIHYNAANELFAESFSASYRRDGKDAWEHGRGLFEHRETTVYLEGSER